MNFTLDILSDYLSYCVFFLNHPPPPPPPQKQQGWVCFLFPASARPMDGCERSVPLGTSGLRKAKAAHSSMKSPKPRFKRSMPSAVVRRCSQVASVAEGVFVLGVAQAKSATVEDVVTVKVRRFFKGGGCTEAGWHEAGGWLLPCFPKQ